MKVSSFYLRDLIFDQWGLYIKQEIRVLLLLEIADKERFDFSHIPEDCLTEDEYNEFISTLISIQECSVELREAKNLEPKESSLDALFARHNLDKISEFYASSIAKDFKAFVRAFLIYKELMKLNGIKEIPSTEPFETEEPISRLRGVFDFGYRPALPEQQELSA